MIIVKLMGGLGNQMFQYAAARALAKRLHTMVKLDLSFLKNQNGIDTPRKYELHNYNIQENIANKFDISLFSKKGENILENVTVRLRRMFYRSAEKPSILKERHYHFDPIILGARDNVCLEGYWQSEKYFEVASDVIKDEFSVKIELSGENKKTAENIKATNSVSLHVRRGDYVHNSTTNNFHGVCSLDYYESALNHISEKVGDPQLFVFSDDHAWVAENLAFPFPTTYVHSNGPDKGYEDMRLMSFCKHNIIANSSFSWWGAWLNRNPDKIVVAPTNWFRDPSICTDDLIPKQWLRI